MTQEEKARAYDEALNKIKPLYKQAKKDGNPIWSTYEHLIPELAESEDERIRKDIVAAVETYGDFTQGRKEEIYAYLEKQKENLMPNSTELIEMWDKEKTMLEEKDFRDDAWRLAYNAFMDGFARGTCVKLEKQKEPKDYRKLYEEVVNSEWFKQSYAGKSLGEEQMPLPEDTLIFRKGVEEGKRLMMEEAIEAIIYQEEDNYPKELIAEYDGELGMGDYVRIIIVKEDEK